MDGAFIFGTTPILIGFQGVSSGRRGVHLPWAASVFSPEL